MDEQTRRQIQEEERLRIEVRNELVQENRKRWRPFLIALLLALLILGLAVMIWGPPGYWGPDNPFGF